MDFRNRRAIHNRARTVLETATPDPKKIALWYTVILSVMTLVFSLFTDVLADRIAGTGGLSNIGLRSILSTGQNVLPIIQLIVTLCLNLGYHRAVLKLSRQEEATPRTLLDGFRFFGPMLRATLFQALLYLSFAVLTLYASSVVFMMTPYAEPFNEIMDPYLESASILATGELIIDAETTYAAAQTLVPMLLIWLGLFLLLFLPAYYGYRMSTFCIADNPRMGAFACLRKSKFMLRGNRFALLRLDLSLWWFYALQLLISLLCYGDTILPLLGVQLPWSMEFSYYFFFVLSLAVQIVTYYFLMNRVNVTYAVAYEALLAQRTPPQPPVSQTSDDSPLPFSTDY